MGKRAKYYAVAVGRATGVFESWIECQAQVHQYSGAKFRSFASNAEALFFLQTAGASGADAESAQRAGDVATALTVAMSRGQPQKRPANEEGMAGLTPGQRETASSARESCVLDAAAGASGSCRVVPTATSCYSGTADGLPIATGVFAAGGGEGAGSGRVGRLDHI